MRTVAHAFRCAGAMTVRALKNLSGSQRGGRDGGFGCKNQPEHGYQYCDRSSSTLWNQRWGPPPFAPCFEGLKPSAPQGWSSVEWRCKHVERLL